MASASAPHDVLLAGFAGRAILECCSAIGGPGQFVDSPSPLDRLYSQPLADMTGLEVQHELLNRRYESQLLVTVEAVEVAPEPRQNLIRRHLFLAPRLQLAE